MTRKAAMTAADQDPVAARVAVLDRVRARRPADEIRQYPSVDGSGPLVNRSPPGVDRMPPLNLEQWCDDRTVNTFGGRTRLAPAEECAATILESFRSGDQEAVRKAVKAAGDGLDAHLRFLVSGVLESWRGGAPGYAVAVVGAAVSEARRLGWDKPPRRTNRGPEPLSQVPEPGRRIA
jgi:hypothetical protein